MCMNYTDASHDGVSSVLFAASCNPEITSGCGEFPLMFCFQMSSTSYAVSIINTTFPSLPFPECKKTCSRGSEQLGILEEKTCHCLCTEGYGPNCDGKTCQSIKWLFFRGCLNIPKHGKSDSWLTIQIAWIQSIAEECKNPEQYADFDICEGVTLEECNSSDEMTSQMLQEFCPEQCVCGVRPAMERILP